VECRDAADAPGWGPPREEHAFVLAMELLDNLPHDRVCREPRTGAWLQTVVSGNSARPPWRGRRGCRRRLSAYPPASLYVRERRACIARAAAARQAVHLTFGGHSCHVHVRHMESLCAQQTRACAEHMRAGWRPGWAGAGAGALREALAPLEDGLIRRCLAAGDWAAGGKSLWHRMLDFAVGEPGAPARPSDALARACAALPAGRSVARQAPKRRCSALSCGGRAS